MKSITRGLYVLSDGRGEWGGQVDDGQRSPVYKWRQFDDVFVQPIPLCVAPVAQWIEHLTTDQEVTGSTPVGRANQYTGSCQIIFHSCPNPHLQKRREISANFVRCPLEAVHAVQFFTAPGDLKQAPYLGVSLSCVKPYVFCRRRQRDMRHGF